MNPDAPEVTGNRATRRAAGQRGRKLAALGSGAVLATGVVAGAIASFATSAAAATTITVQNTNDSGAGSLREALANANAGDTIDLTGLAGKITLTSGQLAIEDAVTIQGPGASALTVDGNGASRVFYMREDLAGGTVTISGLTITGGDDSRGAGVFFNCDGGSGSLAVNDSVVTGNTAAALGGGLYFDQCDEGGSMSVVNSVVSDNTSTNRGAGGIWFDEGDSLTIRNSTISGNRALEEQGGGITVDRAQSVLVLDSTISGNSAAEGGGGAWFASGESQVVIANSTVTGNTSGNVGGGIYAEAGTLDLEQSTVSGNTAALGGDGLYLGYSVKEEAAAGADGNNARAVTDSGQAVAVVTGSIVAGNGSGTADIGGNHYSDSSVTTTSSVIGTITQVPATDGGGNQMGITDPGVAPLANNGGPTQTMALLPGSAAIDKGPDPVPDFSGNGFDQRGDGFPRVVNGKVDVGAFEVQAAAPAPTPAPEVVLQPKFTG